MTLKLAINGYGRIGRSILRTLYEQGYRSKAQIVAINDIGDLLTNAHLTQYDSTHGPFKEKVTTVNNELLIREDKIKFFCERSPDKLPWGELEVDIVLECTGQFTTKEKASLHLKAGAKKVLISAPAGNDLPTIVYGVNHQILKAQDRIVSNASCTTNCLAPLIKPLHTALKVESGLMTTIHAYTNDQVLCDIHHQDLRRARSATQSMIPTKTGAAAAIGLVLPTLKDKLEGLAIRVPVLNVSLVDLTFLASRITTVEEVNTILKEAAGSALKGILEINEMPLVSIDFNHNPASAICDIKETQVVGKLVKVLAWYDNEWGFSNRMIDSALALANV